MSFRGIPTDDEKEKSLKTKISVSPNIVRQKVDPHLEIQLISASKLLAKDFTGKSDPYVVFTTKSDTIKSSKKIQTLNPIYYETLLLHVLELTELEIQVWDWDPVSRDFIGSVSVDISRMTDEFHDFDLALKGERDTDAGSLKIRVRTVNIKPDMTSFYMFGIHAGKTTFLKNFGISFFKDDKIDQMLMLKNSIVAANIFRITKLLVDRLTCPVKEENVFSLEFIKVVTKQMEETRYLVDEQCNLLYFPYIFASILELWRDPAFEGAYESLKAESHEYLDGLTNIWSEPDRQKLLCKENHLYFVEKMEKLMNLTIGSDESLKMEESLIKFSQTVIADPRILEDPEIDSICKFYLLNLTKFPPLSTSGPSMFDAPRNLALYCARASTGGYPTSDCLKWNDLFISLTDCAGSRVMRKRWTSLLEDQKEHPIHGIYYFVDLAAFINVSSVIKENLIADLFALDTVLKHIPKDTPFVFIFNKVDLFEKKIDNFPLCDTFPDYTGEDLKSDIQYIIEKYTSVFPKDLPKPGVVVGSAFDPEFVRKCLKHMVDLKTGTLVIDKDYIHQ